MCAARVWSVSSLASSPERATSTRASVRFATRAARCGDRRGGARACSQAATHAPRLAAGSAGSHASDESALLGNAYNDDAYAERVQALATELCAASGVPVIGTPHAPTALAITVDRYALLEQLVARLHELDYVDYAQPNSIVQLMK